jgi:hypothetical protein
MVYDWGQPERILRLMNGFESTNVLWFFALAQVFGLLSACFARLSEGSPCQTLCQCVFFVALPMTGIAAALALAVGTGWWLACSVTLAVMILTVTCDFSNDRGVTLM